MGSSGKNKSRERSTSRKNKRKHSHRKARRRHNSTSSSASSSDSCTGGGAAGGESSSRTGGHSSKPSGSPGKSRPADKKRSHDSSSSSDCHHRDTKRSKMKSQKTRKHRIKKKAKTDNVKETVPTLTEADKTVVKDDYEGVIGPDPKLMQSHSMKPMSKEEWDKQQSVIRHVYDPETGRTRLIKGDGEILEEIVSYEKHKEINKRATEEDGNYFKTKLDLKN